MSATALLARDTTSTPLSTGNGRRRLSPKLKVVCLSEVSSSTNPNVSTYFHTNELWLHEELVSRLHWTGIATAAQEAHALLEPFSGRTREISVVELDQIFVAAARAVRDLNEDDDVAVLYPYLERLAAGERLTPAETTLLDKNVERARRLCTSWPGYAALRALSPKAIANDPDADALEWAMLALQQIGEQTRLNELLVDVARRTSK